MSEERLYEYQMLRDEIMSVIKDQHNLSIFSITVTITILTYALSAKDRSAYLFAVPLLLLLPTAMKIHELKSDIMDICSYLAVRGENRDGIYWETMLNAYRKEKVKRRDKIVTFFQCSELPLLGMTCILLYCRDLFIKQLYTAAPISGQVGYVIVLIIIVVMDILMFFLTFNYVNMNHTEIDKRKRKWERLLKKQEK